MLLPLAALPEDDRRQVVLVIACVCCFGNGTDDHFSYWQVVDVEVLCAACDFFRDGLLHLSQFQLLAAVVAIGIRNQVFNHLRQVDERVGRDRQLLRRDAAEVALASAAEPTEAA